MQYQGINGKIFLQYVNKALNALDDGRKELTSLNSSSYPDITLNLEAGADSLIKLVTGFNNEYPQIRLFVRKANTQLTYSIAKYDLAIFMISGVDSIPDYSLTLFEEDLVLAVPDGHPMCGKLYVNLEDLKDEKFIFFQKTSKFRGAITKYCESVGFNPNVVSECHDWHMLCEFIKARIGISIVPKLSWESSTAGLHTIPIRNPSLSRKMVITWFDDNHLTASSKLFIEYATKYYNDLISHK